MIPILQWRLFYTKEPQPKFFVLPGIEFWLIGKSEKRQILFPSFRYVVSPTTYSPLDFVLFTDAFQSSEGSFVYWGIILHWLPRRKISFEAGLAAIIEPCTKNWIACRSGYWRREGKENKAAIVERGKPFLLLDRARSHPYWIFKIPLLSSKCPANLLSKAHTTDRRGMEEEEECNLRRFAFERFNLTRSALLSLFTDGLGPAFKQFDWKSFAKVLKHVFILLLVFVIFFLRYWRLWVQSSPCVSARRQKGGIALSTDRSSNIFPLSRRVRAYTYAYPLSLHSTHAAFMRSALIYQTRNLLFDKEYVEQYDLS